jgi:hypothetical protein
MWPLIGLEGPLPACLPIISICSVEIKGLNRLTAASQAAVSLRDVEPAFVVIQSNAEDTGM